MAVPGSEYETNLSGTYSRKDNSLTITIANDPLTFEITKIDADNLHVKLIDEYEEDGIKYVEEIEQKFIR